MIKIRVAFVLRLLDDFTGKALTGNGSSFTGNGIELHPVKKTDGMFVFTGDFPDESYVTIDVPGFHRMNVRVVQSQLDPAEPILNVRMFGKAGGDFEYKYDLVCGKLKKTKGQVFPACVYTVSKKNLSLSFKSYREEDGKKIITFQGYSIKPLIGFCFMLGEGKNASLFSVSEKIGGNEYVICPVADAPVQIKQGTQLKRIYRSVTDKDGGYAIPVNPGEELSEEVYISSPCLP